MSQDQGSYASLHRYFYLCCPRTFSEGRFLSQTKGLFVHCRIHCSAPHSHGFWPHVCWCGHAGLHHGSVCPAFLEKETLVHMGREEAEVQQVHWPGWLCDQAHKVHWGVLRPIGSTQPEVMSACEACEFISAQ